MITLTNFPLQTLALILILISQAFLASGQKNILNDMNFDKGEWELYGKTLPNNPVSLREDSLGNFYTNNSSILNEIKSTWQLKKSDGFYWCGYHYNFYFIHNDTLVAQAELNLECNQLCINSECYKFPLDMLRKFYPHLNKKIPKTSYEVKSLPLARKLYKKLKVIDSAYVLNTAPQNWRNFNGYLKIKVIDSVVNDYKEINNHIYKRIEEDMPDQKFKITKSSSSHPSKGPSTYKFKVYCDQNIGKRFSAYPVLEEWSKHKNVKFQILGLTKKDIRCIEEKIE